MPIFFAEMESGTLIHFKINITYPVSLLVVVCHNHLSNKFGFNQSLWNEKTKKQKQKLFKSLPAIEEEASYLSVTARLTNIVHLADGIIPTQNFLYDFVSEQKPIFVVANSGQASRPDS